MGLKRDYIYSYYTVNYSYVRCKFLNGKVLQIPFSVWYQFKEKILNSSFYEIINLYTTFLVKE